MADDSKKIPEGLDEFLTSDNPQGDIAAQGMKPYLQGMLESGPAISKAPMEGIEPEQDPFTLALAGGVAGKMAQGAGDLLTNEVGSIGKNLLQANLVGDQVAMEKLAQQQVSKPFGSVGNDIKQGTAYKPLPGKVTSTEIPKQTNYGKVKVIESPGLVDYGKIIRKADGGEIPEGLNEFIGGQEPSTEPTTNPSGMSTDNMSKPEGLDEFVHDDLMQQKHGSLGQQAITGLEGAARGVLGPVAPALEQSFGVDPEDIRGRQEANPYIHMGAEAVGLGAGMMTGVGEGALLAKAGELGVAAAGLGEASNIAKIGSAALKGSIENMVYSGSDELSKFVLKDPDQSAQSALVDIGLSGLIGGVAGGALGAANPLWDATIGPKVHEGLAYLSDKLGGIEGQLPDAVNEAINASGMEIAPEIKAGLSNDPHLKHMYQTLQESGSTSGMKAQETQRAFKQQASEAIMDTLGKSSKEIEKLSDLSEFDAGTDVKKVLTSELKSTIDPIADQFDKIKAKYSGVKLEPEATNGIANNIAEMVAKEGYELSPSSPQAKLVSNILKELPNLETLEDLRKYQSIISDNTYGNPELRRVGGQIKSILRTAEDNGVLTAAGMKAPEAIAEHSAARAAYSKAMSSIDALNDRLHVGSYSGPKSFIKALGEMAPEDVLRRLSPKGDAGVIETLKGAFPSSAEAIKDFHLSQALKTSAQKAVPGELINAKSFLKSLEKMSPEMRSFLVDDQSMVKITAIDKLLDHLPAKMNPSGTAKALDSLFEYLPASAASTATMMLGHGAIAASLAGVFTKALGRDVPDAVKLGLLKFMGSSQPVKAGAFKTAVDLIHSIGKGEKALAKASKDVFAEVPKPKDFIPNTQDIGRLEKMLEKMRANSTPMQSVANDVHQYMPEHGINLSKTAMQAVNYLNSLAPSTGLASPLDSKTVINPVQQAVYRNALHIAEQPLVVMDKIGHGRLVPQDIVTLQTIYPDLYNRMTSTLTNDLTNAISEGKHIPYNARMSLSMLLAVPLDSTLTPQSINNAQPKNAQQQQPQQNQQSAPKKTTSALNKMSQNAMTSNQQLAARHQKE